MSDTAERKRELGFSERMSEHEALMWNVEKDPWLNPSGAALVVFDKPIDVEEFRRRMRHAVSELPRLYQRVSPGFGRISTPAWAPDPEFELDFHFRTTTLPPPGTERQLFDLGARLYQEPFDRTRPLWRLVVIDGLESGEGALWMITHHAVSDGIGQLRMAEMYQDLSPDVPPAPEVDLEGIIAEAVAEHRLKEEGGDLATSLRSTVTRSASHLVRRQVGIARRVAGELVLWPADPKRIGDRAADITAAARGTIGPLAKSATESDTGSPLWRQRSRHRHLEHVRIPLDSLKAAAKRHDASVNDAFMAGMVEAAARYHAQRGVSVD
ncbi:MAG: hypothetical protein OEU32_08645, partial [Acidimicrobiia bacterium]|nr:hypothetical protein [Acidimicrobiia bacterium]